MSFFSRKRQPSQTSNNVSVGQSPSQALAQTRDGAEKQAQMMQQMQMKERDMRQKQGDRCVEPVTVPP